MTEPLHADCLKQQAPRLCTLGFLCALTLLRLTLHATAKKADSEPDAEGLNGVSLPWKFCAANKLLLSLTLHAVNVSDEHLSTSLRPRLSHARSKCAEAWT